MNDWNDETTTVPTEQQSHRCRRFPDAWSLIIGLITLVISAYALSDGALNLPSADPRWLIAGGALFVGLMLLGASVRPRRRRDR